MSRGHKVLLLTLWLLIFAPPGGRTPRAHAQLAEPKNAALAHGLRIYDANCAVCHGVNGDGNGHAAHMFQIRPRDFRSGIFKFRSTPAGSLPTNDDLMQTVRDGIRWTGMIARADLAEPDLRAVVDYIKSFSPRFATERPVPSVTIPPAPEHKSERVRRGETLYKEAGCASCHGDRGRGDGPSAGDMKDDWGWRTWPSDLSWRPLKRGSTLQSLYLTISTGLSGSPMPSYGEALTGDQIWDLNYFLETLVPPDRRLSPYQILGEERQGRMALSMGGMMGRGMMGRGR